MCSGWRRICFNAARSQRRCSGTLTDSRFRGNVWTWISKATHQATAMISRYTHPEMGGIWSDQRRYETWLLVETAAADAMAAVGIIPPEAARDIRDRGGFDIAR